MAIPRDTSSTAYHRHGGRPMTFEEVVAAEYGREEPLAVQVGGTHYKEMAIQPFEYIHKNGIGFAEGNVIKYVSRWRAKGGVEDLKKARHFLDLLIDAEQKQPGTGDGRE